MQECLNEPTNIYLNVCASEKESANLVTPEDFYKQGVKEFENWSKTIKFTPEEIFYPENLDQLTNYVKKARAENKKIRCASQGHSWSSLSKTKSCLVVLGDKLSRVEVEKKNDYWVVNVEAGKSENTI